MLAKGFDKKALEMFKRKKNLRVIDISNFKLKILPQLNHLMGLFYYKVKIAPL